MKISYRLRWDAQTGTAYRQTFRITEEENKALFNGIFKPGMNYGNAYTGAEIACKIHGLPEYKGTIPRIIAANSAVFVGNGTIPIY
jgi:hypothetical protein